MLKGSSLYFFILSILLLDNLHSLLCAVCHLHGLEVYTTSKVAYTTTAKITEAYACHVAIVGSHALDSCLNRSEVAFIINLILYKI